MAHLILLGDSILDNAAYVAGGPAVIDQVRARLPAGWRATLAAVDGSTTASVPAQLGRLPADTSHLLLSVGGNDALLRSDLLDSPARNSAEVLLQLAEAVDRFEQGYRRALAPCLQLGLPLQLCTIYNGNFPDADYALRVRTVLALYNDVIVRLAREHALTVIDLRVVCDQPEHYANPIEPSVSGGERIARAIVRALMSPEPAARVCGG